jgi:hypothetical protein
MSVRGVVRSVGVAGGLLALSVPVAQGSAVHGYHAYGSCSTRAPFRKATQCTIPSDQRARGTIVFRSDVGKRDLKVCQRITGLPFRGQQCLRTERPLASEPIPFNLNGASARFTLHVTIYAKPHGGQHAFRRIATVTLRFSPSA